MVKIQRQTQKIFAGDSANEELAVFGSMKTGNPIYTDNIESLQSEAYTQGWSSAIAANEAPFLEEMNGVQYGLSKQLAYLFQNGIPEWDERTTYYKDTSFCQLDGIIYQSTTDDNIGNNPQIDNINWKEYSINFLNKTQITDCITEIPQRIKYTLMNNVLTIKAGTVIIIPYGTQDLTKTYLVGSTFINDNFKIVDTQFSDGKFFVWVEIQADIIHTNQGNATETGVEFINVTSNLATDWGFGENIRSGTDISVVSNGYFYNTSTNYLNYVQNSAATNDIISFPIFLTTKNTGIPQSVNQVFNGFGYISSTFWVDKDVKALFSNGVNSNGTAANIKWTNPQFFIQTFEDSNFNGFFSLYIRLNEETSNSTIRNIDYWSIDYIYKSFSEPIKPASGTYKLWYNPDTNIWKSSRNGGEWTKENTIEITSIASLFTAAVPSSCFFKNPFLAVNKADYSTITSLSFPGDKYIDLTIGASEARYTAPADGYVAMIGGLKPVTNTTIPVMNIGIYSGVRTFIGCNRIGISSGNTVVRGFIPVRQGDVFYHTYNDLNPNVDHGLRFYYAAGNEQFI